MRVQLEVTVRVGVRVRGAPDMLRVGFCSRIGLGEEGS